MVIEGPAAVSLPAYLVPLVPEEMRVARANAGHDGLILAAGRDPRSGDAVFLTNGGELREISSAELPIGAIFPVDCGQTLRIETGTDERVNLDVSWAWALANSVVIVNVGPWTTYVKE